MSNVTGSGELGRRIQELRDRAVMARLIARELSDYEASKRLAKHAQTLEQEAKELENKLPQLPLA